MGRVTIIHTWDCKLTSPSVAQPTTFDLARMLDAALSRYITNTAIEVIIEGNIIKSKIDASQYQAAMPEEIVAEGFTARLVGSVHKR